MPTETPAPVLLRIADVEALTSLSRRFIQMGSASGTFPKPIRCGRAARWIAAEVDDWIRARAAERQGTNGGNQ